MFRKKKAEPKEEKIKPIKKCSYCNKDSIYSYAKINICSDNDCAKKYYKRQSEPTFDNQK